MTQCPSFVLICPYKSHGFMQHDCMSTDTDFPLFKNHLRLVDLTTRGDPMSPLLWTYKGTRNLAEALTSLRHDISHQTVAQFLAKLGNSLQANLETEEGKGHPDRVSSASTSIRRCVRSSGVASRLGQWTSKTQEGESDVPGVVPFLVPSKDAGQATPAGRTGATSRRREHSIHDLDERAAVPLPAGPRVFPGHRRDRGRGNLSRLLDTHLHGGSARSPRPRSPA